MQTESQLSRRHFLAQTATLASVLTLPSRSAWTAEPAASKRFKVGGFTKPFQDLSFDDTADAVAEIGWDGIELALRQKGHVLPERVDDDLPRLASALKKRNLEILTIATDIRNMTDPLTEKALRASAKVGIKTYRLAHLSYDRKRPLAAQVASFRSEFGELLALNKELGLCAAYENHSGLDSVGAPIWDIYEIFKDFDPRFFGICFDIGHATIEGGYTWPTNFRLIQPFLRAVYVKDFAWKKNGVQWKAQWCPLGDGMIDPGFIQQVKNTPFGGPIIQHHEYPVGRGSEMIRAMRKDLRTLRTWLG